MYGVVEVSGHQYRVQAGDIIDVESLKQEEGATVELDKVLLVGGEKTLISKSEHVAAVKCKLSQAFF